MTGEVENPNIEDETVLDKEIEDSINNVRAGQTLEETPADTQSAAAEEGQENSDPASNGEEGSDQGRLPNKGKFESDEMYEKRVALFDLVKRRKAATTPEAKAKLSEDIDAAKSQLKNLSVAGRFNNVKKPTETTQDEDVDPNLVADRERLQQLGGATKEDIAEYVQQEQFKKDVESTVTSFIGKIPELEDPDVRDVFFDFVEENYNWQGKTGKELTAVLGMAYETMFRPAETVQERVLAGANVAEKVNAMQFPGGTSGSNTSGLTPEQKASVKELTDTGMSEEKALELISD